jgi:hypothetical protein
MAFKVPEQFRVINGKMASPRGETYGAFRLPGGFAAIASDGEGWQHVSVSKQDRCPTWEEMHAIKQIFWDAEDAVMQLHPPESTYISCHPYCLHMWKPTDKEIPLPPLWMVGPG